jgi:tetratricopeptide (TPR) repeat protein
MNEPTGTAPSTRAGHVRRFRPRVLLCVFALTASLLPAARLHAGEFEDASAKLADMEDRVRSISGEFRGDAPFDPAIAMRRVVDAEMLFKLKNYSEAATILLDVVEKYPNAQGYDDALVLLGDSLFQEKDYKSARHYFELAVQKNTGSRLEQRALAAADRNQPAHRGFRARRRLPQAAGEHSRLGQLEPSVPYVRGKYAYRSGRYDEALVLFANIPPQSPHYLQARYFASPRPRSRRATRHRRWPSSTPSRARSRATIRNEKSRSWLAWPSAG